jgi:protein TonB
MLVAAMCLIRTVMIEREPDALTVRLIRPAAPPRALPSPPLMVRLTAPSITMALPVVPAIEVKPAPIPTPAAPSPPDPPVAASAPERETLAVELQLQCPERYPPRYPPAARRAREQGDVRMRVAIDEAGRIDSVQIVQSSGSARLDEAAREAVRLWRCQPAQRDGRAVKAVAMQTLAFVLEHP